MKDLTREDWVRIYNSEKFKDLGRRKNRFLFGWWAIACVWFFSIPLGAAYLPGLYNAQVFGKINLVYVIVIVTFLLTFWLNYHYAKWADTVSDPLTAQVAKELLDEQAKGGGQ